MDKKNKGVFVPSSAMDELMDAIIASGKVKKKVKNASTSKTV